MTDLLILSSMSLFIGILTAATSHNEGKHYPAGEHPVPHATPKLLFGRTYAIAAAVVSSILHPSQPTVLYIIMYTCCCER